MTPHDQPSPLTRREMLQRTSAGFGALALSSILGTEAMASAANPLAARAPHFAPTAKRVIFLFMHGGPSQMDMFDYKPELQKNDNKPLPFAKPRVQFAQTSTLLKSPFEFKQHGDSGAWVSELLPNIATVVDDICFVKSLHGSNPAHGGAIIMMHTGSDRFVRPSMGSWVGYGLGTENENLPAFITVCPSYQHGGVRNYSSQFLPAAYHGMPIGNAMMNTEDATIEFLKNHEVPKDLQMKQLDLIQRWQQKQLADAGPNAEFEGRIQSFELAFKMQTEAPDIMSIEGESEATKELYGLDEPETKDFGLRCLMARRFSENGVRFVQATHGPDKKWDDHGNLRANLIKHTHEIDKPIAGLLKDLKSRGLLDETLVLWGGEFGRTPTCEGESRDGRDHNPHGFTMFMAGGGVKPGFSYGATDEFGYYAVENKVHIHDLHATLLHTLGLDHLKLTHNVQGRDFRLTDVAGNVVHDILA